jgi:hypothetical protein
MMCFQWVSRFEFVEEFQHVDSGARGLGAAIDPASAAAFLSLVFVIEKQDFVDDGERVFECEPLKSARHRVRDEICVSGGTFDDDPEANDRACVHGLRYIRSTNRNFVGSGDAEDGERTLRKEGL